MNTKYNYVFYNVTEACYEPVLWPLEKHSFVKVFRQAFTASDLTNKIFFYHWSKKLNDKVNLPFKSLWFKKMFSHSFDNDKPCCYVFLGGKYLTQSQKVYKYIKELNPENKAVVLCGDLISKKNWDIEKVKSKCDMVLTYDEGEAKTYDIAYSPWTSNYGAVEDVTMPDTFENDVYFLGFAKDRLDEIHSAYKVLSEAGCRCKFIICGVEEKDRISGEGLHYIPPISYRENLRNVIASRCILEIIQGGSSAPTLRYREACTYKRKLITNNLNPEYKKGITEKNLYVSEKAEGISPDFAKSPIDYDGFSQEADSLGLIRFLEENL